VDEGRALIPRFAPSWTDHNIHDPGITLMELLAWMVEQDIYRANRIPEKHRRKFLALAGFAPQPPQPARTTLTFVLAPGETALTLPEGVTFATGQTAIEKRCFQLTTDVTIVSSSVSAIQTETKGSFIDRTRLWRDGHSFGLIGDDPEVGDAVYFGFDSPLPVGASASLWFWWGAARAGRLERGCMDKETREALEACRPPRPQARLCPGEGEQAPAEMNPPRHHSVEAVWEFFDGSQWQLVDAEDDTRGMILNGAVKLILPGTMAATAVGAVTDPHFYLRWRLTEGRPDAAPILRRMVINGVEALQRSPARGSLPVMAGVTVPAGLEPVVGERQRLDLKLTAAREISSLAVTADESAPEVLVLEYQPATPSETGFLTSTLYLAGQGDGHPKQQLMLPGAPIAGGQADVWTYLDNDQLPWHQRPDLDASSRGDTHYALDAPSGEIMFGDGENGRVPPRDSHILVRFQRTAGAAGNGPAKSNWYLDGADDLINTALLGADVSSVAARIDEIDNPEPAEEGADAETVAHASGRAAEFLWSHERLVELCDHNTCSTLDQLDRDLVMNVAAPPRATTLLDYERLSLNVPGTKVERVRAWAGIDPAYPCLSAPGTVTVVIVPALPAGRPEPTPGLLAAVYRYLFRRRIIGTRLRVTGPGYVEVTVQASVKAKAGADSSRVRDDIIKALDQFLDPLNGGPSSRGWPFGRDVYRSEILQVIDGVTGVDHVLALDLLAEDSEPQCHNLCVGPLNLVTAGAHQLTVVT